MCIIQKHVHYPIHAIDKCHNFFLSCKIMMYLLYWCVLITIIILLFCICWAFANYYNCVFANNISVYYLYFSHDKNIILYLKSFIKGYTPAGYSFYYKKNIQRQVPVNTFSVYIGLYNVNFQHLPGLIPSIKWKENSSYNYYSNKSLNIQSTIQLVLKVN